MSDVITTIPIPKTIAVVDFFHMLTVNFKARANDAGPNDAGQATLDQLAAVRSSVGADGRVVVCLDSPPYKRRDLYAEYKKGRDREPEFGPILSWTLDRMERDGYQIARAPGAEADDVVATLAAVYSEYGCPDVRIITQDKDMCQCLSDTVRMFVPLLGRRDEFEIRNADWVAQKFGGVDWMAETAKDPKVRGLYPAEIPMALAIMGDKSDNIPGIKGIGIKGAAKLITTYGTLERMAEACVSAITAANVGGKLPAFWRDYNMGMANLPKWLKLTTLDQEAQLEKHPLKYLEVLPVQQLVAEDDDVEREAIQGEHEFSDPDWDAVEQKTEEQQRAKLAAALPVGVAVANESAARSVAEHVGTASDPKPLIGADPNAAEILKQKAAARAAKDAHRSAVAADPRPAQEVINEAATEARQRAAEGKVDESGRPKENPAGANGTATATPAAAAGAAQASVSEVVPPTQGPSKQAPKPRAGDEIPAPTELVRVAPPSWALAVQPSSASEMLAIAKTLFNSRFYSQFGSERGVFAVMTLGRELGMGMAQSVEAFHIVNDKPFMKATALQALAAGDPDCLWIMVTESDDKHAVTKSMHRTAGLLVYDYTIERAARAGLTTGKNKHNWDTKTQEMLEARSKSKASRLWYPRATFGMHSQEEAQDD